MSTHFIRASGAVACGRITGNRTEDRKFVTCKKCWGIMKVTCDQTNNSAEDMAKGILNIEVEPAPTEFVVSIAILIMKTTALTKDQSTFMARQMQSAIMLAGALNIDVTGVLIPDHEYIDRASAVPSIDIPEGTVVKTDETNIVVD